MIEPAIAAESSSTERRAHARIAVHCNALVRLSDTLTFRCLVRNLSCEAAQIVCDARYALLVQPSTTLSRLAVRRSLDISIAPPLAGSMRALTAACVAKYCVPVEGDHMLLGLKFVDLDRAARSLLGEFIAGYGSSGRR